MPASEKPARRPVSMWILFTRSLSLFLLVSPVMAAIYQPKLMQTSDFLMTFYLAGKLILDGRVRDLYPPASATSFLKTPFDAYAHQVLSALPPQNIAIYMYSPLTACAFVPFGAMTPQVALVLWQLTAVAALLLCAWMFSRLTGRSVGSLFWMSTIFFPVFHTLLIGQLGIVLGMLPLATGFFLLMRNRSFLAGLSWALLILKPQFLPTVFLVVGALALIGRWRCLAGLICGMLVLSLSTVLCLPSSMGTAWLHSFRLSDTIFTDARYGYPHYLVCSLPGTLAQSVPAKMQHVAKLIGYATGAGIGLHALWFCRNMLKLVDDPRSRLPVVFLIGIFVLPLTLPHLLFYDLCVFALAGMLIFGYKWGRFDSPLKFGASIGWLACNLYLLLWMFVYKPMAQPIMLVILTAELYRRLLTYANASLSPVEAHPT